ncbi:MAG: hypothetical protein LBV55_03440, partial [Acholeplasmatales bacterium]|nr:hypothetical protein [Acholeplasmatales bacterium]
MFFKKNLILFIYLMFLTVEVATILLFGLTSRTQSKKINVYFDTSGGTPLDSLSLTQGERIDFKLEVAKEGYEL